MSAVAIPEVKNTTSTWNIDPVHSAAQFKVKHMMISNVKGEFTSLQGGLQRSSLLSRSARPRYRRGMARRYRSREISASAGSRAR